MYLEARALVYSYGELLVLDDIDLRIEDGEVLAIIGPSGCGKSTLLSILGGLLAPKGGEVRTGGSAPAGCLNELTFVFQDFALLPWRTVAGNVALPLESRLDRRDIAERVKEALRIAGLAEFADAYPKQLSGGMRQRVGLARGLAVRPAILFMDEPLSALDAQTRELLKEDLLRVWREIACTTAYVTHNLSEAVALADRIVVLSRRPARVREILSVPVARSERRKDDPVLQGLESRLWDLLRDEARDAELGVQSLDADRITPSPSAPGGLT